MSFIDKFRRNIRLLRIRIKGPSRGPDYEMDEVRLHLRIAYEFYEKADIDNALKHLRDSEDILNMIMHREPTDPYRPTQEQYNRLMGGIETLRVMMKERKPIDEVGDQVTGIDGFIWLNFIE